MATKYPGLQWDLQQVRIFVEEAKSRVGKAGWKFLSKPMREGLIAEQVLKVMYANWRMDDGARVEIRVFRDLHNAMLAEAGLTDEDEE